MRGLRRDGAGARARDRGRALLARLRREGRGRQVPRPPPARAAGTHHESVRSRRDVADAVGPAGRGRDATSSGLGRALHARANPARDRPRPDELEAARQEEEIDAVADVARRAPGVVYHRICDDRQERRGGSTSSSATTAASSSSTSSRRTTRRRRAPARARRRDAGPTSSVSSATRPRTTPRRGSR